MKIKIYGILKRYVEGKDYLEIDLPTPLKVEEILLMTGIPKNYVFIVEKNGQSIKKDCLINNSDEISLIPFISGG